MSEEEEIAAEESLAAYCKPVELYNILQRRAIRNVCLVFLFQHKECISHLPILNHFSPLSPIVALVSSEMFAL